METALRTKVGKKVTINGTEWVIPPLTLEQLRRTVMDRFAQHNEFMKQAEEEIDPLAGWKARLVRGDIILEALSRNYTEDELANLELDLENTEILWPMVLGLSGFMQREEGGAAEPGPPLTSGGSITG